MIRVARFAVLGLLLVIAGAPLATAADGAPGCVAASPSAGDAVATSCTYNASARGGYAAAGEWTITVTGPSGSRVYTSADNEPCAYGVIQAGDSVRASVGPSGGVVAVGSAELGLVDLGPGLHCTPSP